MSKQKNKKKAEEQPEISNRTIIIVLFLLLLLLSYCYGDNEEEESKPVTLTKETTQTFPSLSPEQLLEETKDMLETGEIMASLVDQDNIEGCARYMHDVSDKAKNLRSQIEQLEGDQYRYFRLAAINLTLCVTCSDSLSHNECKEAEQHIQRYEEELGAR